MKTLHPKVHGGLLGRRDLDSHIAQLKENGIEFIDMVCVNLYPFKQTIAKPDVTMEDAIENIDIGGPSMLRSAAKNWSAVTVVCNPENYAKIISEIKETGNTTKETRLQLSAEAYTHTAEYDMMIATYMRKAAGLNEKLFLFPNNTFFIPGPPVLYSFRNIPLLLHPPPSNRLESQAQTSLPVTSQRSDHWTA